MYAYCENKDTYLIPVVTSRHVKGIQMCLCIPRAASLCSFVVWGRPTSHPRGALCLLTNCLAQPDEEVLRMMGA